MNSARFRLAVPRGRLDDTRHGYPTGATLSTSLYVERLRWRRRPIPFFSCLCRHPPSPNAHLITMPCRQLLQQTGRFNGRGGSCPQRLTNPFGGSPRPRRRLWRRAAERGETKSRHSAVGRSWCTGKGQVVHALSRKKHFDVQSVPRGRQTQTKRVLSRFRHKLNSNILSPLASHSRHWH